VQGRWHFLLEHSGTRCGSFILAFLKLIATINCVCFALDLNNNEKVEEENQAFTEAIAAPALDYKKNIT